ncbi:MAG: exodeoxyribonuclease alpha subunit [Solirubrobacteraceae bacterium]|jgi:exodeoxyribonuclease V alpha subunit|nr:exodeoxyribonuclease alpha subunit [Solirubrobacteraceae bacterium]
MTDLAVEHDLLDAQRVRDAPGLLRPFNDIGLLAAADVHVAVRLTALAGDEDELVALAAALAVRAPRMGHVYVDLATVRETATVESDEAVDVSALPWPPVEEWIGRLSGSGLVTTGEQEADASRPLRLVGTALYLDRYWREERQVAADLEAFGDAALGVNVRESVLAGGLARLFDAAADDRQRLAAASAVLRRLAVVAGGPGTGKTTTVARIVALLFEQAAAAGAVPPLIALAAPTGKAAARLEESVHEEAAKLTVEPEVRAQLLALNASTLHRLLGWRPGSHSRFRHHRGNRLPHDVVIVDETSMVSLSLMARLVEAVRPDARLILVGDPGQLTSIEAGAVLGDIVGPAAQGLVMSPGARAMLAAVTGRPVGAADPPPGATVGDGIVVLDRVHRFGEGIAKLAGAVRNGDADKVIRVLAEGPEGVTWIPCDVEDPDAGDLLGPVRTGAVSTARAVIGAAEAGAAGEAIDALGGFRVLCAHRRGPHGVATWMGRIEGWLGEAIDGFAAQGDWYVGRPLLVTQNDYGLGLYNGDTGVVVATEPGRVSAAFERRGEIIAFRPTRLSAVETVYAMTVHKSQGSQFDTAAVLLPPPASQILTRELLYTAVTRARKQLVLVGTEETIRAAVARPAARASGLRWRLWGEGTAT